MSSHRDANGFQGNPYVKRTIGPVEATMASAYEQRTANLIAALAYCEGDSYESQLAEINARLGITS